MALPFFFNPQLEHSSKTMQLDEATSKHVVQVLRMKEGEQLNLTNGKGLLARMELTAANKKNSTVLLLESEFSQHHAIRKTGIAISPVKNSSRFEWFLEKATELGVSDIFPLLCNRTEREHFRFDRMQAICISAMLQSQQTWLPILHEPIAFKELVSNSGMQKHDYTNKWIAHCTEQKKQPLVASLSKNIKDSLILIGPEGDFTPEEIKTAITNGYHPVALGDTRLRTETAGMVAAALLMLC
jgi:16S rRNA (uracil1498-N3)-methyltransferase